MTSQSNSARPDVYPGILKSADAGSNTAQKWYLLLCALRLSSLVTVAAVAAFSVLIDRWGPIIAIAPISVAVASEIVLLILRPDRRWHQCRTIAETAKSLAWRYQVGGRPFALAGHHSKQVDQEFVARIQDLVRRFGDSHLPPARDDQVTSDMRAIRSSPLEERKSAYLSGRLQDQMQWYADKADWNRRRADLLQVGLVIVELGALGAAVWGIASGNHVAIYSLLAGIAIAVIGWLQIRQHGWLANGYTIASHDIASIRATIDLAGDEGSWADFVGEAEDSISREHTVWVSSLHGRFSL